MHFSFCGVGLATPGPNVKDEVARIHKAFASAAVAALAGCASFDSGAQHTSPTHHWARADASIARYNFHTSQCLGEMDVNLRAASSTSPDFLAYRACMEGLGYELVALAPLANSERNPD